MTENSASTQVFHLQGRLDSAAAPARERELQTIMATGVANLVIDLTEVSFLSSAGLRVLLVGAKACRAAGGQAVLVGPQESVTQVLQMSGFDRLLKVFADRQSALASLPSAT